MATRQAIKTYPIIEMFGPVLQGEGAMIGRQTHFLRLGGCDYRCSWCDTLYAVQPDEVRLNSTRMSSEQIVTNLSALGSHTPWVTISGGNPALHQLDALIDDLKASGWQIAVETQGTLYKHWLERCDLVTISPKPPSSRMNQQISGLDRFVRLPQANLKVVVFDEDDFQFARHVHFEFPEIPFYLQVGNDLSNDSRETLLEKLDWLANRTLCDPDMAAAVVLPQLHVLMYGNRRGV